MDFFPDNTLTRYTTKLPSDINLSGEWEVGLVEIQYPVSWYNIEEGNSKFAVIEVYPKEAESSDGAKQKNLWKSQLTPGYYPGPGKLVKDLNEIMKKETQTKNIKFSYNETNGKVSVELAENFIFSMDDGLRHYLGFDENNVIESKEAPNVVDINQGFYSLYVYTDILEQRIIGDTTAPLLRVVPVKGHQGDLITKTYENIQYFPVQKKTFSTIEINIRTDMGTPVKFQRGKVYVTLHFRKKRLGYF